MKTFKHLLFALLFSCSISLFTQNEVVIKAEDEIVSNGAITKKYDDLNYRWGFINSEKIRRAIYLNLVKN